MTNTPSSSTKRAFPDLTTAITLGVFGLILRMVLRIILDGMKETSVLAATTAERVTESTAAQVRGYVAGASIPQPEQDNGLFSMHQALAAQAAVPDFTGRAVDPKLLAAAGHNAAGVKPWELDPLVLDPLDRLIDEPPVPFE